MAGRFWLLRATTASAVLLALLATSAGISMGASHREAPLTASDPQIDATDLYAFTSPDAPDTVSLISNWIPFQEPSGGPNFYQFGEGVRYNINVDNDGDAKADIVYRWTFKTTTRNKDTFLYNTGPVNSLTDETLNVVQTYKLERVEGDKTETLVDKATAAPSNAGRASMPDYARLRQEAVVPFSSGPGKSFAGQADDAFFLDLRVFDLLYGANLSEVGNDTLDGYNVNTLAVQVPKKDLAKAGNDGANPIVGVWTTAERQSNKVLKDDGSVENSGKYVQVSRLGNPLVNEAVVPLQFKDAFNASKPADDKQFLAKVQDPEVPKLIEKIYNMPAPAAPRDDLVSVFLTGVDGLNKPAGVTPSEQLRLNMSIPPSAEEDRLGVIGNDKAGFPNGRRLGDDVVDIALQVLEGELKGSANDLGDGVDANDVNFESSFPYVGLPHSGSGTTAKTKQKVAGAEVLGAQTENSARTAPQGAVAAGAGGVAGRGSGAPVGAIAVTLLLAAALGGGAWLTLRHVGSMR